MNNSVRVMRIGLVMAALAALAILAALPLAWKEQAMFGAALVALAVALNAGARAHGATLALMGLSTFATVRYAHWRTTQTFEGLTSVDHLYQWDAVFVLALLAAEFYAFATLF